jgi:ssDNA-binding Zn-finger/Zn-ribbon topoisomerase 1
MKNIHILPTNKLIQNIYITSDEEIKEGDWLLIIDDFETYVHKHKGDNLPTTYHKKIILTTDQDLIKNGVQAIGDEFLEWFVKNPSCEFVEVKRNYLGSKCLKCGFIENHDEVDTEDCPKCHNTTYEHLYNNKIIISQEDPKQEIAGKAFYESADKVITVTRQETLEEAAESWVNNRFTKQICGNESYPDIYASKEGIVESHIIFAKWQQEQDKNKYNEEDMIAFAEFIAKYPDKNKNVSGEMLHAKSKYDGSERTIDLLQEWIEQFKKK